MSGQSARPTCNPEQIIRAGQCDHPPTHPGEMLLKEFLERVRWRRVTSVIGHPTDPPYTWSYASEPRLSRVVGGAVELDTLVGENEKTQLIGKGGTAYVSSPTGWRSMNVSTWTLMWANSNTALTPVAPLRGGRVAMHDTVANTMTDFAADGTPGQSAPFSGGNQTAFGLSTQVEVIGSTGILTGRVSLALDQDVKFFRVGVGSGSYQNAPEIPPGRTTTQDDTAILLMKHLLVAPPQLNPNGVPYEHAGHVCKEPDGQHYYFHHLGNGTTLSAPPLYLTPEQCTDGTTVGYAHSHPGHFADWEYPSGYRSYAEYLDNDPADGDPARSDLWIADSYFDNPSLAYVGPNGPNVMWYVTSPKRNQTFLKYKKTASGLAKDNLRQFDYATRLWGMVAPVW